MSTSCGSRRRIAHLSNFSKNPGSGHSVLILFPSVQCPEDMWSMLPWAARIRGLITWSWFFSQVYNAHKTCGRCFHGQSVGRAANSSAQLSVTGQTMTKDQPCAQRCRTAVDAAKAMKQNASLISCWCLGQMLQEGAASTSPSSTTTMHFPYLRKN